MKRSIVFFVALLFLSTMLYAQAYSGLSVQVGMAKITSASTQGMITGIKKLNDNFVITAGIGYSIFTGGFKKLVLERYSYVTKVKVKSAIPLHIGGRFYCVKEGFNPCVILEWGINRLEEEVHIPISGVPGQTPPEYVVKNQTVLDISYGIGFGALIAVVNRLNVDVNFIAHQRMDIGDYVSLMVGANYLF